MKKVFDRFFSSPAGGGSGTRERGTRRRAGFVCLLAAVLLLCCLSGCSRAQEPAEQKKAPAELSEEAKAKMEPYKSVGNVVTFGHYEQDNDSGNGPEAIEWIVLDVQEGKCLLLSKNALFPVAYNKVWMDINWNDSYIRNWLNYTFLNDAFSEKESSAILQTIVINSADQGYPGWNTAGGPDTRDRIFLLSYAEAHQWFGVEDGRQATDAAVAYPTAYAVANKKNASSLDANPEHTCRWWLRSPGSSQSDALLINYNGSIYSNPVIGTIYIRPALWLDLTVDFF